MLGLCPVIIDAAPTCMAIVICVPHLACSVLVPIPTPDCPSPYLSTAIPFGESAGVGMRGGTAVPD